MTGTVIVRNDWESERKVAMGVVKRTGSKTRWNDVTVKGMEWLGQCR
jgi:hypothetical protein